MERSTIPCGAAIAPRGDIEIDSAVIARSMKMPVAHFMAEMRRGRVHGLVEQGMDEDEGRYRLSFRYRGRELRMVYEADGRLIDETLDLTAPPRNDEILRTRLRQELVKHARARLPTTCTRLADRIAFSSPKALGLIGEALEALMEEDAGEGRPLLAAVAVRTVTPGLPAAWFFQKASVLGLFTGDPEDVEAYAFHAQEFHHAVRFYSRPAPAPMPLERATPSSLLSMPSTGE